MIDRREFVKTGALAAAFAALPAAGQQLQSAGRRLWPLSRGWRYIARHDAAMVGTDFNDGPWSPITLPHTNLRLPWHGFDERSYEFVSTYRRWLPPITPTAGRRVFLDFEGAMTASTVYLNGQRLGSYRGGYTPFSFELTGHLSPSGRNVLAVALDSTEVNAIPPFGGEIDYLTFGGIYREVHLREVPEVFIANVHVRALDLLSKPRLEVDVFLDRPASAKADGMELHVELLDGDRAVARQTQRVTNVPVSTVPNPEDAGQAQGAQPFTDIDKPTATVKLDALNGVALWELNKPQLYTVRAQLVAAGKPVDEYTTRIGFREARFTPQGFSLNGKIVKLHGLDRHQTFPWVGQAMPARVQRRDAYILRHDLHCNIVRTSHYPQSRHFLDACDELGLLVLEEIPGWQHIGDAAWKDVAVDNVRRMVTRDWNHPSIVLWGTRINESPDDHDFYTRTNALAHALDTTRQNGGIRNHGNSELLEDVFTINDFGFPLREPNHPLYLNTEFVGHTFPTKTIDDKERLQEHVHRHARVHDQIASNPQYAGGIGWCAFDYTTHANFGSGDRICYHGVMDIFRTPKFAAFLYKSMCDPAEEIVLEPAFHWARNDESVGITDGLVCSNCDHLKAFVKHGDDWRPLMEADPDRATYPHLPHAPFRLHFKDDMHGWGDLRIDGFIGGRQVISRTLSGSGVDHAFRALPDDTELIADGADTTRLVLRVEDEFGNIRPWASDGIRFDINGPVDLIGDNPFGLIGGTGAVWIRAREVAAPATITAIHPNLGRQTVRIELKPAPAEA